MVFSHDFIIFVLIHHSYTVNMRKIVIASDSFKGSLSSAEVASVAASAIREVHPSCEVVQLPVSDGGEGLLDAFKAVSAASSSISAEVVKCLAADPLMRPLETEYLVVDSGSSRADTSSSEARTAIIESASAAGLCLLRENERNPLETTTYGVGMMIMDAIAGGCRKILLGIGGTATNDAGTGLLSALGFRFKNKEGECVEALRGRDLKNIAEVDVSGVGQDVLQTEFVVACDVDNPFCGPSGAAFVFAPQKGADKEMVEDLDEGLRSFAEVMEAGLQEGLLRGRSIKNLPGAGAAGGSGGAMAAFLGAELKPGIETVLDALDFDRVAEGADLIITGEGCLDSQSAGGKTPYGVMHRGLRLNIPVVAVCGSCAMENLSQTPFAAVQPLVPAGLSEEQLSRAMLPSVASANLRLAVLKILENTY